MNELIIKQITVSGLDELKAQVAKDVVKYNNLVIITPDDATKARNTRASLNTFRTEVDNARKKVNKDIKAAVDEILELIDEPIDAIDKQIKAIAEAEKQKRQAEIEAHFEILNSPVSLERIQDPKWLNADTSTKAWKEALEGKIRKINEELKLCELLAPENYEALKQEYLQVLDIATAKANYDCKKAAQDAASAIEAARVTQQPIQEAQTASEPTITTQAASETFSITLKAVMSPNALYRLESWMDAMKIAYTIEKK